MDDFWSPLCLLIEERRKALGLTKSQLAQRCGCKNLHKGVGWIDAISRGHTDHPRAREILVRLPAALEICQTEFDQALAVTLRQLAGRDREEQALRDAAFRANFKPHAYLVTESSVPSQIVICGLAGGPERWLRIELDSSQPPLTFVRQALAAARVNSTVPFFGRTRGVAINYRIGSATLFDLAGNPLEVLDRGYRPGAITLGGRIAGQILGRTMGLRE